MSAPVVGPWNTNDIYNGRILYTCSHKGRSEFICVDGNPTATIGTHASKDGALLYFVEGACGSLPCGPYTNGYELTCAVCTK